ncbi:MAG: galactitol-1-phosphate 5-dehydrogenase [Acidobacteria bacterium 13_2_20CM_57_17]|nr:MAG: galactitol-1-phosphate 5-dehydrogenase [Acidobacteria bacterium 13_2_20CM_57_17]
MKALLLSKYRHLEIADLPNPTPGPAEILVKVAACGICGSDVHGYDGSSGRRIPPIVMGHEAAGRVAKVGPQVTGWSEGDRVTFDSTISCGACRYCARGEINLCDHRRVLGVSCADYSCAGAFAEYVIVPQRIVYRLPDSLSFSEAAMLEAVAVAVHAVALSKISSGDRALVLGAGMIGLLTLQALRAAGCSTVYVADVDASRLKLAKEVGATETLHATGDDLVSEILRLTNNAGIDLAVEAVGIDATVRAAVNSVRKGGTVTLVGNITPEVTLPLQKAVTRQIRLQGSCASAGEYPKAIELLTSGAIKVKPLITAVAPLDDGPQWFERLYSREPNLMKVVLTPETIS